MPQFPIAQRPPRLTRQSRNALCVNAALIIICLVILMPIAVTLLFTVKSREDITRNPPVLFPCDTPTAAFDLRACRWSLSGYQRVLLPTPSPTSPLGFVLAGRLFTIYMPNTVLYASAAGLLVVLLSGMSAYAIARYHFRGRNTLMVVFLALSGLPWMSDLLALYLMTTVLRRTLPVYDDRLFVVAVYTGFFLPLSIWIAKGFFEAIPRELEEAALVDGCSPAGGFVRITLPLAAPGLAAIFLLTFVGIWNEFITAYLLISENQFQNAMFGMYDYLSMNLANPQVVATACAVVATPVVVVFLLARKYFFQAVIEGAVKG